MSCRAGHRQDSEPLWLRRSPAAAAAWEPSSGNFHVLRVHPHMLTKRKKKVKTQIRKSERSLSPQASSCRDRSPWGCIFWDSGRSAKPKERAVWYGPHLLRPRPLGEGREAHRLAWPTREKRDPPAGRPLGCPVQKASRDNDTGLPSPTLSTSGHGMWWPQRWFILIFEFLSCGQ